MPRPTAKRRPGRPAGSANRPHPTTVTSPASDLIGNVHRLIADNTALLHENASLKARLARVSAVATQASTPPVVQTRGRRRRSEDVKENVVATPTSARRTRKKITDPVRLERMRAALAKARQARADRKSSAN